MLVLLINFDNYKFIIPLFNTMSANFDLSALCGPATNQSITSHKHSYQDWPCMYFIYYFDIHTN